MFHVRLWSIPDEVIRPYCEQGIGVPMMELKGQAMCRENISESDEGYIALILWIPNVITRTDAPLWRYPSSSLNIRKFTGARRWRGIPATKNHASTEDFIQKTSPDLCEKGESGRRRHIAKCRNQYSKLAFHQTNTAHEREHYMIAQQKKSSLVKGIYSENMFCVMLLPMMPQKRCIVSSLPISKFSMIFSQRYIAVFTSAWYGMKGSLVKQALRLLRHLLNLRFRIITKSSS